MNISDDTYDAVKVAKYLKKKRRLLKMKYGTVCRRTGLHANTVKRIEAAEGHGCNVRCLKVLCDFYGTTLARMFKFCKM